MSGHPAFRDKIDQWVHGESPGCLSFPGSFTTQSSQECGELCFPYQPADCGILSIWLSLVICSRLVKGEQGPG